MNVLPLEKQIDIITLLCTGSAVRETARRVGVHQDSVARLDLKIGEACSTLHNQMMRNLQVSRVQVDEQWAFIKKKQKRVKPEDPDEVGDIWQYVAFAPIEKAILSYFIGKRSLESTKRFMLDLRSRVVNRFQLTSDGYHAYIDAVDFAFEGNIDFGQLVKTHRVGKAKNEHPFTQKVIVCGNLEPNEISTSLVERLNLSTRMASRRFTRRTNAHSKKLRHHAAAVARWFAYYNFCRLHSTLRTTPAVALGVADQVWSVGELIERALASSPPSDPETPATVSVASIAQRPSKLRLIRGGKTDRE